MNRRVHGLGVTALGLAGVACGGGGGSGTPAPGSASGSGSAIAPLPATIDVTKMGSAAPVRMAEPEVPLPKALGFELVSAGSGALAPLRYALAPGPVDYLLETRMKSRALQDGAWTTPIEQVPLRNGFAIAPGDKAGFLAVRALPIEILGTKTPEAAAHAATWTKNLANRRLAVTVDDRGRLGTLDFQDDPNRTQEPSAREDATQRWLGTLVPLPAEPVGVGASWRVMTALRQGLAVMKQTGTYTLTARTPKAWTIHAVVRRDAEDQTVTDPRFPPGTTTEVVAIVRTLEGDLTVVPTQPLGTGTLAVDSRAHLRITPPKGAMSENILEDTGSLVLTVKSE